MAMVNNLSVKDSRWLQIEVCREFQRNICSRADSECKFAHPSPHIEIQNGRVIACYDSIKGRCNREKPPCKYFHPPQHLKDQLLINGRNHLALKNALLQQMPLQTVLTAGQLPLVSCLQKQYFYCQVSNLFFLKLAFCVSEILSIRGYCRSATNTHYITNLPAVASASAYGSFAPPVITGLMSTAEQLTSSYGILPAPAFIASQKSTRTDRLECLTSGVSFQVCREFQRGNCKRAESECRFAHPPEQVQIDASDGVITVCMDFMKGRCCREHCRYFHPPPHLQTQLKAAQNRANATALVGKVTISFLPSASHVLTDATYLAAGKKRVREDDDLLMTFPGVVPLTKRPALEKSGMPMYQPSASAYQQALAVHQSFVPLSRHHHPGVPRL
ncbi:muscleblind-like protein 1 isoform X1 [Leptotrombidium deliense]|uniref:Muscleblind-like protein 1 isoform X1 n=1 Tax=Leptotrombidium deliense TaxID=299467 RepID=A0A443SIR4_9ACAR|nr:muscleblind-like protein 1 isoform X1 [Leptotrombidium deliense]